MNTKMASPSLPGVFLLTWANLQYDEEMNRLFDCAKQEIAPQQQQIAQLCLHSRQSAFCGKVRELYFDLLSTKPSPEVITPPVMPMVEHAGYYRERTATFYRYTLQRSPSTKYNYT